MSKLKLLEHNDLYFWVRENTSDIKAFKEVIVLDSYQKRGLEILNGEDWLDLGGNVGAFAILALSKGANVEVYEPDPISCKLIEKNLKQNSFNAKIINKAVVGNTNKTSFLSISKTGQYWRNSLVKDWKGGHIKVECINFNDIIKGGENVKMDIEGSEMEVIENWDNKNKPLSKLVFEWSFDMDDNIDRYREAVRKCKESFDIVKADSINEKHKIWGKSWFPPCKNIYCLNGKK